MLVFSPPPYRRLTPHLKLDNTGAYRVHPYPMSHTIREKSKLQARVRRIKGQVEAIERALEAELGCAEILNLVASIRGAVTGLTAELIEDHIREHIVGASTARERAEGGEELIEVVRTYVK